MIEGNTKLDTRSDVKSDDKLGRDTIDPIVNSLLLEPLNALSNGFNFAAEKTSLKIRTGKFQIQEPEYDTVAESAIASVVGGLAASVPYAIAGQFVGGIARMATRRFDKYIYVPAAIGRFCMSQRTANVLGSTIYDGLKDTRKGETHLGNALGGAASFVVFEHGNAKSQGLKGLGWLTHHMKIGAAGGLAHAVTSDIASGKNPIERKDYLEVCLNGAAMNSVFPILQKGLGHLVDKVNVRAGRGIPIERDFARQGSAELSELGKTAPLTRVHRIDKAESPRANHKEQAIFVRDGDVRQRAHETQHLVSTRAKTQEPLFQKAADALKNGDEWLAWQSYRQARLQEELAARKAELLVGKHQQCMHHNKYTTKWLEEFLAFKESKGTYRPNEDFSYKFKVPFKERGLASVESDLQASGAQLGTTLLAAGKLAKPRELTLTEARKLLGLMTAGKARAEKFESDYYRDYYEDNSNLPPVDWQEFHSHHPYDPKFTRAYKELIKGKSDGARWIAKQLKFRAPVENAGDLTQDHLDDLGRKWNLFKEIAPVVNDQELAPFHLSPYHLLENKHIASAKDAEAFVDLWAKVARPNAQFRFKGNPSPYSVGFVAKYCSALPMHGQIELAKLPAGVFYKLKGSRIGNPYRLLDCLKAWKVEPDLPKNVAEQVGRMPMKQILAAEAAWNDARWNLNRDADRAEKMAYFWERFKDWSDQRPIQFYKSLTDSASMSFQLSREKVLDRALATFHGRVLSWEERREFRRTLISIWRDEGSIPFSSVVSFKAAYYKNALAALKQCKTDSWDEGYWCGDSSVRLVHTFGHQWQKWLKLQEQIGVNGHDATHWLPNLQTKKLDGLDNWLFRFYDRPQDQLRKVASCWSELSDEGRKLSYKPLLTLLNSRNYANQKHEQFSAESARWGVPDRAYSKNENRWLASQQIDIPFPTDIVWKSGNLTARFLPRDDVRGLYLGQHTYCCQHPDGVGKSCAWHGQESPQGGFFVIEDGNKNIVTQSWTWLSDDGGVCFDSIEGASLYSRDKTSLVNLYEQAAEHLAQTHYKVTVGKNSKLDTSQWDLCERLEHPTDFSGYANDSQSQGLIASNPTLASRRNTSDTWVRGARENDLDRVDEIAKKVYPSRWDFASFGDHALVLDTKKDGVVGYASFDSDNQYISDIAVLPQFTQYSMKLFNALGNYMRRIGGVWSADCRESTSYKFVKLQAKRGRLKIESEEKTHDMEGEQMYRMRFSLPERNEN